MEQSVIFDHSLHLGQFVINNESVRIAAKNMQIAIADKQTIDSVAYVTYNENSYTDDFAWSLDRQMQDAFFPFMDLFHSVKHIKRVPLEVEVARYAATLSSDLSIHMSNALTIVTAVTNQCRIIQSLYTDFQKPHVLAYLHDQEIICQTIPKDAVQEQTYDECLESRYQAARAGFQTRRLDPFLYFHS